MIIQKKKLSPIFLFLFFYFLNLKILPIFTQIPINTELLVCCLSVNMSWNEQARCQNCTTIAPEKTPPERGVASASSTELDEPPNSILRQFEKTVRYWLSLRSKPSPQPPFQWSVRACMIRKL